MGENRAYPGDFFLRFALSVYYRNGANGFCRYVSRDDIVTQEVRDDKENFSSLTGDPTAIVSLAGAAPTGRNEGGKGGTR